MIVSTPFTQSGKSPRPTPLTYMDIWRVEQD